MYNDSEISENDIADKFFKAMMVEKKDTKEDIEKKEQIERAKLDFQMSIERQLGIKRAKIKSMDQDEIVISWGVDKKFLLTRSEMMKIFDFKPFPDFMFLNLMLDAPFQRFYATYIRKVTA